MNSGILIGGLLCMLALLAFRRGIKCSQRDRPADAIWWTALGLFWTLLTLVYAAGYGVALWDS